MAAGRHTGISLVKGGLAIAVEMAHVCSLGPASLPAGIYSTDTPVHMK